MTPPLLHQLQTTLQYYQATGRSTSQIQDLLATWHRSQTALLILSAQPHERANTPFVLAALTDIMTLVDTTLLPPSLHPAQPPPLAD